jgi:hypothetical protein
LSTIHRRGAVSGTQDDPRQAVGQADQEAARRHQAQPGRALRGDQPGTDQARHGGYISIQDDKLPDDERRARTQIYTPAELAAFIADAKAGRYDHLI